MLYLKKSLSIILLLPPLVALIFCGADLVMQRHDCEETQVAVAICLTEHPVALRSGHHAASCCAVAADAAWRLSREGDFYADDLIIIRYSSLDDIERELEDSVNDMLGGIDLSELEAFLSSLSAEQRAMFQNQSFGAMVRRILGGDNSLNYENFGSYVMSLIFGRITFFVPLIITILAIVLAMSMLSAIKGKFAGKSVENIAHFASISIIIILVTTNVVLIIGQTVGIINALQLQMNVVFPILLTMMATVGATSTVAVYQPSVVLLSGWIINLVTIAIIPTFIFSFVFAAVGSISKENRLSKLSDFFSTVCKWILGIVFFLFLAFLSLQGVTAAVYDGISIRTARFAISRYVPIIGGYLSEGFNLMLAGGVLIKNAVGMGAVILLIVSILPVVINIIVFSLSLRLAAALCEPLGADSRISDYLHTVSKHMNVLLAILLGVAFLYFIFVMLIIFTGNMVF